MNGRLLGLPYTTNHSLVLLGRGRAGRDHNSQRIFIKEKVQGRAGEETTTARIFIEEKQQRENIN
jgi:hypothetical protein